MSCGTTPVLGSGRPMAAETDTLRRTPLHGRHAAAGAKLVPFAGWEMPVQYTGIREEHTAVREHVGIFDVSHMGQVETSGPGALALLQRLLSNDVEKIAEGGAQYSVLCNDQGGVLDDLFTYRLGPERYLTVTNASNHARDLAWFQRHAADRDDVTVADRIDDFAMLAVQGPEARALVAGLTDGGDLPKRFRTAERTVAGVDGVLVCGTGYTGEDGVELLIAPQHAGEVWDAVVAAGATPVGLGARDTLRLEACFHLYGNDLSEDRGPIEAGLGWCCKEATGFIGAEPIAAAREHGTAQKLVPFAITGQGIARQGNPVIGGGVVTTGTLSPTLGYGIGLAYLPAERTAPGTPFEIDVRGKTRTAEVRSKPLIPEER
jgi:aminomethyltransferase